VRTAANGLKTAVLFGALTGARIAPPAGSRAKSIGRTCGLILVWPLVAYLVAAWLDERERVTGALG